MGTELPRHPDPRVHRIIAFYERLSAADLARLAEFYTDDASFKDPFNEVRGVPAIAAIFRHMFASLDGPRFVVHEAMLEGRQCFLSWDFVFRLRPADARAITVRGGSHLRFAPDGRVEMHRDYWDAAEELYEKLPVLGALMRWLKRRVNS
jgi:ketosteroid isomerase-like protein